MVIALLVIVIAVMYFTSSDCKNFDEELKNHYDHNALVEKSNKLCSSKQMISAGYNIHVEGVDAVCLTRSPPKIYRFTI